jgi:hypothetical protein
MAMNNMTDAEKMPYAIGHQPAIIMLVASQSSASRSSVLAEFIDASRLLSYFLLR